MPGKTITNRPLVGVAIVCWNNEDIISKCLDSVHTQTYGRLRTIVLDNNSSDGSVDLIERKFPWAEIIKSPTNTLFAKGNNLIIGELLKDPSVKYIVLLNSDATLDRGWVEQAVRFLNHKTNVAFLQGQTLDFFDHDVIDSTHIYLNRNGQAIQANYRCPRASAPTQTTKVFGANAAACLVTRDFLTAQPFISLFDEQLSMYLEDVDVAARALALGWESFYLPQAVAYHMGSASSGKNPGFSVYMVNRNIWAVLWKNLPTRLLLKTVPRLIAANTYELFRILRGKNYKIAWNYVLGMAVGILTLGRYWSSARLLHVYQKTSHRDLWNMMKDGTAQPDQPSEF